VLGEKVLGEFTLGVMALGERWVVVV